MQQVQGHPRGAGVAVEGQGMVHYPIMREQIHAYGRQRTDCQHAHARTQIIMGVESETTDERDG